jgi:beta-glucosidase
MSLSEDTGKEGKKMSKLEEERKQEISAMINKMSLEEKVSLMLYESMEVQKVGIPAYNWWSECLHGVARQGEATVFPQAIGLAATFDDRLAQKEADVISTEARAKWNETQKAGLPATQYRGLTFWTPNINIFRDPRWGRGQETYGEDPYLTSRMGTAFVKGLQGTDPDHLKVAACAKHYAVHSGPEKYRHEFNAVVSKKDLFETYLPAFKALVDAGVESVMGAYNRTLGEPCCGSKYLLKDILRGKWGFKGHVVSDCWAVRDFHEGHHVTKMPEESAALAINNGCDLNCGCTYHSAVDAVHKGLLTEDKIDEAVTHLLMTRFKLGMFDSKKDDPWKDLNRKDVHTEAHIKLAEKVADESIVLLKNKDNLLPISKTEKKKILVFGPAAANIHTLLANYNGLSSKYVTILEGISQKIADHPNITPDYIQGCPMYCAPTNPGWAVGNAKWVDVVIACFGLDNAMEGEEGDAMSSDCKGDRNTIELPEWQLNTLKQLHDQGTPIVLVLTGGAAIAFPPELADAIVDVWYPGEVGGKAVADVLFGDVVPSGHLPVTFPKKTADLPPYEDYDMKGRTYRYMEKEPLFPFGFGLSYTTFAFEKIALSEKSLAAADTASTKKAGTAKITATVTVKNTGTIAADEVVQLYVSKEKRNADDPISSLKEFKRVHIAAGKSAEVTFMLNAATFETVAKDGNNVLAPGAYTITAADAAPTSYARSLGAAKPATTTFTIK